MKHVFTIEEFVSFMSRRWSEEYAVLKVGDRFKTTDQYSADDGQVAGVITGRVSDRHYEVNDELKAVGFTEHEVYSVRFDDGTESVCWPMEVVKS